jgi:hypothetical protein
MNSAITVQVRQTKTESWVEFQQIIVYLKYIFYKKVILQNAIVSRQYCMNRFFSEVEYTLCNANAGECSLVECQDLHTWICNLKDLALPA